ncbi:MAG TPA: glycosyltransferase family A protein [Burkholderiales bacterium]|nr:glycosyltransferase family A protein [Burkholderiales bacterium]
MNAPAHGGMGMGERNVGAGPAPSITVVIPTFRRPDLLARCLEAVAGQSLAPPYYEVMVCDDGCDPDTERLVRRFEAMHAGRGPRFTYIAVTATQGPAGARNRGWREARTEFIAFTDDDTIPHPHWLAEGLQALRLDVGAVAGRIEVPLPPRPTDYELDCAGLARAEFATANCFVRRAVLERVRGFDEHYTAAWREDSDLQFAILCAGYRIGRAERAVVVHPVRPARWGVSIAQQRKSQFDALLYKKYRGLYANRIATPRPWRYYAIVLCLLGAAAAALGQWFGVALACLAVWAGLSLGFALRRLHGTATSAAHRAEMLWTSLCIPPLSVFWRLYGAVRFRVAFF